MTKCSWCFFPWSLMFILGAIRAISFSLKSECIHLIGKGSLIINWVLQQCHVIVPFEVNVILKLTHLPPFPEYTLDLCGFPRGYGPMRPVSMEGLVIAMTRVTKYTQGARFLCNNDDCPCSTGTADTLPSLTLVCYS